VHYFLRSFHRFVTGQVLFLKQISMASKLVLVRFVYLLKLNFLELAQEVLLVLYSYL